MSEPSEESDYIRSAKRILASHQEYVEGLEKDVEELEVAIATLQAKLDAAEAALVESGSRYWFDAAMDARKAHRDAEARCEQAVGLLREFETEQGFEHDSKCAKWEHPGTSWSLNEETVCTCIVSRTHAFLASLPPAAKEPDA